MQLILVHSPNSPMIFRHAASLDIAAVLMLEQKQKKTISFTMTGFPLLHGSRKGIVVQITGGVFRCGKTRCKHGPCIEGN